MNSFNTFKVLIYQNHIFPEVSRTLKSVTQYLLYTNHDLDWTQASKMNQLFDNDEKKRLNEQKDKLNEKITYNLQQYHEMYILPFKYCPNYYQLLFHYAILKSAHILKNPKLLKRQSEEPLFVMPDTVQDICHELKRLLKCSNIEALQQTNKQKPENGSFILMRWEHLQEKMPKSQREQKLLHQVYNQLYPYQKKQIFKQIFQNQYKQFLISKYDISAMIADGKITRIDPFYIQSPCELYQSLYPQHTLHQSRKTLMQNSQIKLKMFQKCKELVKKRKRQLKQIQEKYSCDIKKVEDLLRNQFQLVRKFQDFSKMTNRRLSATQFT